MNDYEIMEWAGAGAFEAHVGALLRTQEAENSLLLGLLPELSPRTRYFAVDTARAPILAAVLQPGRKLLLSRGPPAAALALARHLWARDVQLPGVFAPDENIDGFAREYAAHSGRDVWAGLRMRLHALESVTPLPRALGRMRDAVPAEHPLLAAWARAFVEESGADDPRSGPELIDAPARAGRLLLWEHEGPRTMLIWGRSTATGAAITLVYTPPSARGRGYATSCVAETSTRLLAAGHRFVCLFTDLANPIPNSIYAKIGFRGRCDFADSWFVSR